MTNVAILGITGPPGSGKGTQAERLTQNFDFRHLSTGDLLREEIRQGSELGRQAEAIISRGELVSDALINDLMEKKIRENVQENPRLLLDGYPRTVNQLEYLVDCLAGQELPLTGMIYLKVDEEVIIDRLSGRLICGQCGSVYHRKAKPPRKEMICDRCEGELTVRQDDTPESIRERLVVYDRETRPVLEALGERHKGLDAVLFRIPANEGPPEVFSQIRATMKKLDISPRAGA